MDISKSKSYHGKRLYLGANAAEIFQLSIQIEQSRLTYPKITHFEKSHNLAKNGPKTA